MSSLREDPDLARRVLEEKRTAILHLLEQGEEVAAATAEAGQPPKEEVSPMDTLQEQAMAHDIERRRRHELARIDAALERLEAGEYGWCVSCGEPIPNARLELDPAVALCVACAGKG
ncbi:TraR/DksA family transcriptional regulator [Benzoatithermus flavus]|uniref:TraR/DksA family transcriptional regulator n=1 Tax=Benzoatithermus flavus TaxID=3108223 RepID=A0ABU8XQJ3_9PROT